MEGSDTNKTSTGLTENLEALFCYVLGFITGIIFLIIEKDSKFVRFHAIQSIATFLPLVVINYIVGILPLIGGILSFFIGVLEFVLWILLMYKAYKKVWFKLPIVGDIAEQQINK
ncbi:MAG: DUF4870 domain-containing protein [Acetivibrionales bacterium]|jgi:uncharacterized membrane protein